MSEPTVAIITKAKATYWKPLYEAFAKAQPEPWKTLLIWPENLVSEHPAESVTPRAANLEIQTVPSRTLSIPRWWRNPLYQVRSWQISLPDRRPMADSENPGHSRDRNSRVLPLYGAGADLRETSPNSGDRLHGPRLPERTLLLMADAPLASLMGTARRRHRRLQPRRSPTAFKTRHPHFFRLPRGGQPHLPPRRACESRR